MQDPSSLGQKTGSTWTAPWTEPGTTVSTDRLLADPFVSTSSNVSPALHLPLLPPGISRIRSESTESSYSGIPMLLHTQETTGNAPLVTENRIYDEPRPLLELHLESVGFTKEPSPAPPLHTGLHPAVSDAAGHSKGSGEEMEDYFGLSDVMTQFDGKKPRGKRRLTDKLVEDAGIPSQFLWCNYDANASLEL